MFKTKQFPCPGIDNFYLTDTHLNVDLLKYGWRRSLAMPGSSPTSDGCGSAGELQIPRRQADRDDVLLESYRSGQLHQSHVVPEVGGRVLRVYLSLLPTSYRDRAVNHFVWFRRCILLFCKLLATRVRNFVRANFDRQPCEEATEI